MLARQDHVEAHAAMPTVTIRDPDTGKDVDLKNKFDTTSLGHVFSADATSRKDMDVRMAKADVGFYAAMKLWRCPVLKRRHKLRMYRRYLMILVYAGAVCWILDEAALRRLNHWNGAKMAAITGHSHEDENDRRRVRIGDLLRYWQRRLLGEILRAHPDDIRRPEVIRHAELVRKGRVKRHGSIVMDSPAYDTVAELEQAAGYVPEGSVEQVGIARTADLERRRNEWIAADEALRPTYGTDSEEEDDDDEDSDKQDEAQEPGETDEQHAARMQRLQAETERAIQEARAHMQANHTRLAWVIHHDGGYTPAKDDKSERPRDRAGWGFRARLMQLDAWSVVEEFDAYGPVVLDPGPTYVGCVTLSNNTAELSAVPHALVAVARWREGNRGRAGPAALREAETLGVIMAYDSQYTKDRCTAQAQRSNARAPKNATVVAVCRRLVRAAKEAETDLHWVKVKGHSGDEGNDAADTRANWAQNGGSKNEQDVHAAMTGLTDA